MSAAGAAALIIGPLSGALADRYGRWRVMFVVTGIMVAVASLPALAGDLIGFAIALAVINGLSAGAVSIAFSLLAETAGDSVRGRVMSVSTTPIMFGFMIGPAIGSVVTQSSVFTVYPLMAVFVALGLVGFIAAGRFARPDPTMRRELS
jgi:MFS family permease